MTTISTGEWTASTVGACLVEAAAGQREDAIDWLAWLPPADADLVWARAQRQRWKMICWRFGVGRATAHRRRQRSLEVIASRLNRGTGNLCRGSTERAHLIKRETFLC
jgi:hypothetical protein